MAHSHGAFSLDDVRDVVFHTDAAGLWVYLNSAWTDVTGFTLAESIGKPFFQFVHPDDQGRNLALFGPLIRREKDHCLHEVRYLTRDGGFRWIEVHARLTLDAAGAVTGTTGSLRDVTARRQEHAELEASRERLALALEAAHATGWEYDVAARRLTVHDGAMALADGLLPSATVTAEAWRDQIHPDDADRAWRDFQEVLAGHRPAYESEYRMRGRDGWQWVRSRGRVVSRDADGRPLRVVGTALDVSELRALQERLLEATRLASVGTLAAGVAHEINNPLAWVTSNLEALRESLAGGHAGDEPPGRMAEEALQGARRIAEVVKAMRSLGRPERPEPWRQVDAGAELLGALKMVHNQLAQRARVEVEVEDGLPPVRGHTSELGRAFLNILVNAAQAIPEGQSAGHRIGVRARRRGGEVVVEITDDGPGMAPAVRQRIFEPFFTTKDVGQGSGLGLSIARSAVEAAGGRIEVESEPGRGTTFRIRLPMAGAGDAAPAPAGEAAAARAAPAAPRCRVLVIDDEPMVRRALERSLRPAHQVTALPSATEALSRLDAGERWDAILCDMMMPELDGVAFHEALRARHADQVRRLAFLTGGAFGDRATRFLAANDVPVLEKPIEPGPLQALLERLAQPAAP